MASAQVKGVLTFYRVTSTGAKVRLFSNNIAALGPSGSSDGTIASTPEKWTYVPLQSAPHKILEVNDQLEVTLTIATAATTDASDGEVSLPVTYDDGSVEILGGFDDTTSWDVQQLGDTAFLAGVETTIAKKTIRKRCALGSNVVKAFVSVENNA